MLIEFGKIIGVGRIHFEEKGDSKKGQIRYMAVTNSIQRKGLGSEIVLELEAIAKNEGIQEMVLNARENAIDFYLSLGYKKKEPYKSDTGIPHITMRKKLS